jgi:Na+-transporting NADH:ubiquinone oxidoreductase subunit A
LKFKGGYNIFIQGRPESSVQKLPEPKELYLPLHSRRFYFSNICVKEGQRVEDGDVLAKDPDNYSVPLLAPRGGTVRLKEVKDHIVLAKLSPPAEKVYVPEKDLPHIVQEMGASGLKRYRLLSLGAWQFFYDAYTGQLPDPLDKPQAVIVSTLSLEPFEVRGDVQLKNRLLQFTRGLEHLQSLLEYQPMYLVMPDIKSEFATLVREHIRGYAWAKLIEIPLKYPYDNFNILARKLGLSPAHLKAMAGYPVKEIIDRYVFSPFPRIINGGIFTGTKVTEEVFGLETECRGITILPEHKEREFLGFIRPGWERSSYSGCFLSSLRKEFRQRLNTAMYGEGRPCVSCNYCEEVCPANIMPHLLHKYLYRDLIEEVDQARVDLCIECGLCSYVCPSKIDLRQQFIDAKELIEKEKEEIRLEQERQEKLREEEQLRRKLAEEAG